MVYTLLLILHVLTAVSALLLGAGALSVVKKKGWHTRIGNIYHWLFATMAITASILATMSWQRLWWFLPIAVFSYAFALLGFLAVRLKWKNWLRFHVLGQGGSFIAMCTAATVNNFGYMGWISMFLPVAIGVPILVWFSREVRAGRRPKYSQ